MPNADVPDVFRGGMIVLKTDRRLVVTMDFDRELNELAWYAWIMFSIHNKIRMTCESAMYSASAELSATDGYRVQFAAECNETQV